MTGSSIVEGMLLDWVRTRLTPEPRLPVSWLSAEEKAEELQRLQANRARDAAREAELILALAADRPEELDPPPGTPGARRGSWRPDGGAARGERLLSGGVVGGAQLRAGHRGVASPAGLGVERAAAADLRRAQARGDRRAARAGA